jgi:hypothetical protein
MRSLSRNFTRRFSWWSLFLLGLSLVSGLAACGSAAPGTMPSPLPGNWNVTQSQGILHIAYGSGTSYPEYAAVHLESSYFRLNYGPTSGWGTSIILLPVFWSQRSCPPAGLCQGAPITTHWQVDGATLLLNIQGTIAGLHVNLLVRLSPPTRNTISAHIAATVQGNLTLDSRPGEAFKPVMLSSMHISPSQWDAQLLQVGARTYALPLSGWIIHPPVVAQAFRLEGGTSSWKTHAPTVEVILDQPRQVTGWVTQSNDPNDDNVGVWAASDKVLASYSYSINVSP